MQRRPLRQTVIEAYGEAGAEAQFAGKRARATVKNHVHTILVKLGITRRDQVAARLHT